jgi:hypothetical protein
MVFKKSRLAQKMRSFLLPNNDKVLHSAFVPTGAMQLLNTLKACFPAHHLVAADFDSLPAPVLGPSSTIRPMNHPESMTSTVSGSLCAANAPLVASKTSGMLCVLAFRLRNFLNSIRMRDCLQRRDERSRHLPRSRWICRYLFCHGLSEAQTRLCQLGGARGESSKFCVESTVSDPDIFFWAHL